MNPLVADLSHHNWDKGTALNFRRAKDAGLVGVVYKATEGQTYQDPFYARSKAAALDAGLLWGAYHFATKRPAQLQVDNFLRTVNPDGEMLVAVDFERNEPSPANTTTPAITLSILELLETELGRKPVLYNAGFVRQHAPAALRALSTVVGGI